MDKRINLIQENPLGTRPSWDEWFLHLPIGMASRASCHNVHSASIVVGDKQIIGEGYNGAPTQFEKNCIETGCRKSLKGLDYVSSLNSGNCIGIHSEMNAVGHLSKLTSKNLSLYTTIFPCTTCAKNLLPYNLTKIIFKRPYDEKEMHYALDKFEEGKVEVYQLDMSPERYIDIAFNHPNVLFDVWSAEEKQRINKILGK